VFYLIICILAVWLLGRAFWNEGQSSENTSSSHSSETTDSEEETTKSTSGKSSKSSKNTDGEPNSTELFGDNAGGGDRDDEESGAEQEQAVSVSLITPGIEVLPAMQLCIENLGLSMTELCDFSWLYEKFYTLNSGTSITADELDGRKLLSKDLTITKDSDQPQILIYHTHSQEAYRDSVSGEADQTVVGVGDYLTQILTEQYGYNVLHDTGVYDMTDGVLNRDSAYQNAYPAIEDILAQYPSIQVVIDLHRDGVREDVHLVTDVNGVSTARIMFFNGVCRDENGPLEDLQNPYLEDNLAFSLQMRLASMLISEDFCRTNYLKTWRYNQQFLGRSLLVEVGAQTNTFEEALNACTPLAQALDYVLGGNQ
jgi:stage II sporulation protein P